MAGPVLGRLVTAALENCCHRLWGFSPLMIASIVEHKGPIRALAWFTVNMPRYLLTLRMLGPVRTHLAGLVVALHHNCLYCAFGQAYALELIYLRDTGRLFPLDARLLADWLDLEPRRLGARLRDVLAQADLHTKAVWVDLTLAFATGEQQPIDATEVRLAHVVHVIGEMSRIALLAGVSPDGPHNSINKDTELKARHAELRRPPPGPVPATG